MHIKEYNLNKWLWTEEDYEEMGWHDATIHAFAFLPDAYEFVLDIDYIFEWVPPALGKTYFKFWVAPATLIFENVNDLRIDLEPHSGIELQEVERSDPREPRNAIYIDRDVEWNWTLSTHSGDINLRSVGFKQYIRQAPILTQAQVLDLNVRGGFSFFRGQFAK